MSGIAWSDQQTAELFKIAEFYGWGMRAARFAAKSGKFGKRSVEAIRVKLRSMREELYPAGAFIPDSSFPRYDAPLVMEGDALVLPDVEAPYHDADFIQQCIDLAGTWGIKNLVLAGDFLHFDSLSNWGANWVKQDGGEISQDDSDKLLHFLESLPRKYQEQGFQVMQELGGNGPSVPSLGRELSETRKLVLELAKVFERVDFVIGNHEGRLLRALDSPLCPSDMLELIRAEKWRVAPYYYSLLVSNGETFRITHPKTAAKYGAEKLAAKHHQHILMAHSHAWRCDFDISGEYWAIQMGHCVDEMRLPYAAQRDVPRDAHALGAVIIRDGFPWLLGRRTPWRDMRKMI
jgi:hypothetical protein